MHVQSRHALNKCEVGMLFAVRSSHTKYLTSYAQLNERQQAFARDLAEHGE
jgi:hypothetical protein